MFWLFLGVLIWSVVHLIPSVLPDKNQDIMNNLGAKYTGAFAGVIVLSIILIIIGWRSSAVTAVYHPVAIGSHVNMLFMFVAIVLLGASHGNSRIRQYVRHPMLVGTHIWALGHLLANGDNRSVVLFGGMLIWSALSIYFIDKRDGEWEKPAEVNSMDGEIKLLAISVVVYLILVLLHPYFAGRPVM